MDETLADRTSTSAALKVEELAHTASTAGPDPRYPALPSPEKTVFYLAYGSNLCSATFQGQRSIHPLSATAVRVPSLTLTFDLPGIPYLEPCFANVRSHSSADDDAASLLPLPSALHGVAYELTAEDYAKLIATEGGGAGYGDEIVACHPIAGGEAINAHTLLAPAEETRQTGAQPSLRYLELIREGAREHKLPEKWREYLDSLQEYRITSVRQTVGKAIWTAVWLPPFLLIMKLADVTKGSDGRSPGWVLKLQKVAVGCMWTLYDWGFKQVFGDGERTVANTPTGVEKA